MSTFEIFALSVALGADLFSVAVPIGMNKIRRRLIVQAAAVFALFHVGMILVGYYTGRWISRTFEHLGAYHFDCPVTLVENVAQGIGALVLAGLGIEMIFDHFRDDAEDAASSQLLQGTSMLMIAASVSVDALAAGFSLGMLAVDLWLLNAILGSVIFIIAVVGLRLGRRIGNYLEGRSGLIGGVMLLVLSMHLLYSAFL